LRADMAASSSSKIESRAPSPLPSPLFVAIFHLRKLFLKKCDTCHTFSQVIGDKM
jgi:hypothetical protein